MTIDKSFFTFTRLEKLGKLKSALRCYREALADNPSTEPAKSRAALLTSILEKKVCLCLFVMFTSCDCSNLIGCFSSCAISLTFVLGTPLIWWSCDLEAAEQRERERKQLEKARLKKLKKIIDKERHKKHKKTKRYVWFLGCFLV